MTDDFVKAVFDGRVVVTNVRGLDDRDRVVKVIERVKKKEVPDTFDLIHQPDDTSEDKDKWAKWFHWAPKGALLLVDEGQDIWRKSWRDGDLKKFDYPGGPDKAKEDGRPETFRQAFEKHRHYNWDMVLTTPNIKQIRPDIRECSEGAFKHKNQALVGLKGRYLEGFHTAESNGNPSDFIGAPKRKKVPPYVFELYQSTATGEIRDSEAGISIWKDTKFLGLVALLVVVLALVTYMGPPSFWKSKEPGGEKVGAVQGAGQNGVARNGQSMAAPVGGAQTGSKNRSAGGRVSGGGLVDQIAVLRSRNVWYVGGFDVDMGATGKRAIYFFELVAEDETAGAVIDSDSLAKMGISVHRISRCLMELRKKGETVYARCRGVKSEEPKPFG